MNPLVTVKNYAMIIIIVMILASVMRQCSWDQGKETLQDALDDANSSLWLAAITAFVVIFFDEGLEWALVFFYTCYFFIAIAKGWLCGTIYSLLLAISTAVVAWYIF